MKEKEAKAGKKIDKASLDALKAIKEKALNTNKIVLKDGKDNN